MTTNRGIKEAACDSVECPDIGHQRQTEDQSNEDKIRRVRESTWRGGRGVGNLCSGEGEEEEQEGADEFAKAGNKLVPHGRGYRQHRKSPVFGHRRLQLAMAVTEPVRHVEGWIQRFRFVYDQGKLVLGFITSE